MPHHKKKHHFPDLHQPEYYIDREVSWLAFNERVIEEAEDESTPLLERLRFLGIASNNLDEFFMVRVSGIQEQLQADVRAANVAGLTPEEKFREVHRLAHVQVDRLYETLRSKVLPAMAEEGITLRKVQEMSRSQKTFARGYFDREVFPVLTPLAVDSGHPFPQLRNLSLNLAVRLSPPPKNRTRHPLFAVVQVPVVLNRVVRLPSSPGRNEFVLLEDLISEEIKLLFPGMKVQEACAFRVTRDADIEFAEEEADDLLKTIEEELRMRERGSAVRLGIEMKGSKELVGLLSGTIGLSEHQVYRMDGPIDLSSVAQIVNQIDRSELKFSPYVPSVREPLRSEKNIFKAVAQQDVLLHHPYESFAPVSDFIQQAAKDPNVLAIKQTLYRTSGDSIIAKSLMEAAENGKQVAALMELKARFDEERNIGWAKQMERAGVHVVYGLVGLKTHAKIALVVRREPGGLRRYVHLGTGNYNPTTAKLYTDLGLLTCDPDLCDDASELFNLLTGYSRLPQWRKMVIAPVDMRPFFVEKIDEQIERSRSGKRGRIRAKMNSLVDPGIIGKLYEASNAGVKIELMVRGICCLRPGLKGVSENIQVSSTVGRYLEHSRLYMFGEGDEESIYLSSADWMQRNLDRRVEALFPIESPALKRRLIDEIWEACWHDNFKRRDLLPDGTYIRRKRGDSDRIIEAQSTLMQLEENLRMDSSRGAVTPEMLVSTTTPPSPPENRRPVRPAIPAARLLKSGKASKESSAASTYPLHGNEVPLKKESVPNSAPEDGKVSDSRQTARDGRGPKTAKGAKGT